MKSPVCVAPLGDIVGDSTYDEWFGFVFFIFVLSGFVWFSGWFRFNKIMSNPGLVQTFLRFWFKFLEIFIREIYIPSHFCTY